MMTTKLRVAVLLNRFPVVSQTFILTQMRGVQRAGHEVDVISSHRPRRGEPVHGEATDSGLVERTHYVESALAPDAVGPIPSIPLRPGRHDVLHAHFGPDARRFLFARAQAKAPLVVTFHGYDYSAQPRAHGAGMYGALFERADLVTYNCEHARLSLEGLGCPPAKLVRTRLPIAVAEFAFRPRRLEPGEIVRIVTVGRLVEKKGHRVALQAIAEVAREVRLRYDIVGDGPLAEPLAKLIRDLDLEDVVRLHGAQDSDVVRRLLGRAHLFVLASREGADGDREGTPVALLEAQACGLPVVSTTHAGIPEIVPDGGSGSLVAENEPRALAHAIRGLIRDHETWLALGARGRSYVERNFDIGPCTEELLGVYTKAVRAGPAAVRSTAIGPRRRLG